MSYFLGVYLGVLASWIVLQFNPVRHPLYVLQLREIEFYLWMFLWISPVLFTLGYILVSGVIDIINALP